eukprot:scpid29179/ scgid25766/ 
MDMQESHYFVRDGEEPVSAQDAEPEHSQHEEVEVTQSVMPAQGYTDSDPHDAATPAVIPATSLVQPLCAAEIRIQELEGQLKLCRQNTGSIERAYDDKLTVELEEKKTTERRTPATATDDCNPEAADLPGRREAC